MRVALAVEGSRGDVYPMLDLGDHFLRHGHEVVLCAPPDMGEEALARGMEFRPVGRPVRAGLEREAEALFAGGLQTVRAAYRWFRETARLQLRDLPDLTRDVDQIIGAAIQIGAPSAAELHGIPYRYVVFCPALLPSREYPPPVVERQTLPRWMNSLAWKMFLAFNRLTLERDVNLRRRELALPAVSNVFSYLLGERPVVAVDSELAVVPGDCPIDVEQIDCLHAMAGEPLPPKVETFLTSGPPPIYVGFGSMPDLHPARTTEILLAAIRRAGCRAIISEGWAGLGDGPLPEGVLRIGSVTHANLFPRVAAAIHHGGAGTTSTAARCGVPQIVVPHTADQFYWGHRVASLGLGPPPLLRRDLSVDALTGLIEATLDNDWLASRARVVRDQGRARRRGATDPVEHFL